MKRKDVGGQAVIEGVMMRGSKGMAIAVRKEDGEIDVKVEKVVPLTKKYKFLNIPLIRGIFVLVDSLKIGMDSLNHSASFIEEDEDYEPESKFERLLDRFEGWLRKKYGEKAEDIIMSITMGIAFLLAIGLFIGLPTAIATIFKGFGISPILLNLIEAAIRISILIIYIWGIEKLDDMYRVFQYHGAEHKTIFCYEAEEELTVENVKRFSRFHPRCGTNFLFLIMFVSVFIFSFTGWGGFLQRIVLRILLIPIVAGITYEIIKWLGKSNGVIARIISYPGLKLQGLTTREPDDKQIEVAIASLKAAEGIEEREKTIGELLNEGTKILGDADIDTSRLDSQLLLGKVLEKDKLYLITNSTEKVSNSNKIKYFNLIKKRQDKMPVRYILGECDFMGLDFYVEEGVLIPRSDTEVLVEEVLKLIPINKKLEVCDLCSGSGAIGISLAHYRPDIKVDEIDLYPVPEKVTKKNIIRNNLEDRVSFIKSDLLDEVIKVNKRYNIIVSNPPYIKEEEIETLMEDVKDYEPKTALSGGDDGLVFYRKIVEQSKETLLEGGMLCFEIGYDQGESVKNLLEENRFVDVKVVKDLAGLDRVVLGKFAC